MWLTSQTLTASVAEVPAQLPITPTDNPITNLPSFTRKYMVSTSFEQR
jgi:hypothetical protein